MDDEGDLPDDIIEWIDDVFGIDDTDIIDIITHNWKKYFKIDDNLWKSMEINENRRKSSIPIDFRWFSLIFIDFQHFFDREFLMKIDIFLYKSLQK